MALATATPIPTSVTPAARQGLRRWAGWVVIAVTVIAVVIVIAAPGLLNNVSPTATTNSILSGPSAAHWFGTDQLGRDIFSRTVYGARPVLIASLLGVVVATAAGVALGLAGGVAP